MRVALIHHVGYSFTGLFDLAPSLAKRGHEVIDIYWNGSKEFLAIKDHQNLTRYLVPGLNFSLKGLVTEYPYLPQLPMLIEMVNPKILHAQSHLFLPTFQAIRAAKKLGLPSIITIHGVAADRNTLLNFGQRLYLRTIALCAFNAADKIICLTRSDAERINAIGCPYEKIRIIPNAVNVEHFKPIDKHEESLVIWTGRFVPEKGLEYLIEAARIIAKNNRCVKFLLIGYGPLKAKLVKLASHYGLLGKSVEFGGPYERSEMPNVLSQASIFVLPSLSEGLSISVLEAMACGLPVVCTDIAGVREVVQNGITGILVPPRNPFALSKAIMTLLISGDLRRQMGQKARKTVVERYNWESHINQIERVYSEVIAI